MRTTEQSKKLVRRTAIGGSLLAMTAVGVAFAANPYPHTTRPPDPTLASLQQREKVLARDATILNAEHTAVWDQYKSALAERTQQIEQINAVNSQIQAQQSQQVAAATSSSSQSYAQSSPQATYVPSAPVASSGAS
jgi:hypothetical protein